MWTSLVSKHCVCGCNSPESCWSNSFLGSSRLFPAWLLVVHLNPFPVSSHQPLHHASLSNIFYNATFFLLCQNETTEFLQCVHWIHIQCYDYCFVTLMLRNSVMRSFVLFGGNIAQIELTFPRWVGLALVLKRFHAKTCGTWPWIARMTQYLLGLFRCRNRQKHCRQLRSAIGGLRRYSEFINCIKAFLLECENLMPSGSLESVRV